MSWDEIATFAGAYGLVAAVLSAFNLGTRLAFKRYPDLLRFAPTIDIVLVLFGLVVTVISLPAAFFGQVEFAVKVLAITVLIVTFGFAAFLLFAVLLPEKKKLDGSSKRCEECGNIVPEKTGSLRTQDATG